MYGMMHITGETGGDPVKPGVAVTDVLTGEYLQRCAYSPTETMLNKQDRKQLDSI